jgi:NADH dehydrogenase FAD-containing subunit
MKISRRALVQMGVAGAMGLPELAPAASDQRIVIIGGGFGGLTAAKYLRRFGSNFDITLIEPESEFIMCPMSMRVIEGGMAMHDISRPYAPFARKYNIHLVKGWVDAIDPAAKQVTVGDKSLPYDRLIVSPGVEFNYDNIAGLQSAEARARTPHAWKAGPQTLQLRDELIRMPPGGTFVMHIAKGAIRAKTAPYERISLIAAMLQTRNPRAKILAFDANADPAFGRQLVLDSWKANYGNMIEYVSGADIDHVDAAKLTISLKSNKGTHKADVLNIIPPQRAGAIARKSGLANVDNGQWCGVNFLNMESTAVPGVHVLGDAIAGAPGMPKSGQMANQEAKVCAAAIANMASNRPVNPEPIMIHAGYMYLTPDRAVTTSGVYRYNGDKRTMVAVKGAGGASNVPSLDNGLYAMSWATNIFNDMME